MMGIGCDLVRMARLERMLQSDYALRRILTPAEQAALRQAGQPLQWLAGRWAAKEAVAKALGCGLQGCPPQDVEILPDERGKPCVRLTGKARQAAGDRQVEVSISHDGDYALAYAVAISGRGV